MSEVEIAKRGEQIFSLSFRRLNGRVSVFVRAHPSVEELLKSWGSGISSSIYDFGGRGWIFPADQPTPEVWDLDTRFAIPQSVGDFKYTLARPGFDLYEDPTILNDGSRLVAPVVNISFLRIVGISGGAEFALPGVHSVSYLKELQTKIQQAVKRLYTDYLLPIDLTVQINTQETRL